MIKKDIYGDTLKDQLLESAKDRMVQLLFADGAVRGAIVHGTKLVNEMRANHGLGVLETLVLGHAYLGILLASSNLKGEDRIAMKIDCSGPLRGLSVEANTFGEVRGHLMRIPIPVHEPLESFDLLPFFGDGVLSITKYLSKFARPFTGQVALRYGNIAQDMAYFSVKSEQTPSAYNLSVQFDQDGKVTGAGGLMIQVMPGVEENVLQSLEELVFEIPSLGQLFAEGETVDSVIQSHFAGFSPKPIHSRRVAFMCHCSKKRFRHFLTHLPPSELEDILEKGPFPVRLTCHNCSSEYTLSRTEIERIHRSSFLRVSRN